VSKKRWGEARKPIFLGRTEFNATTQTYSFSDGSGHVPAELKQAVEALAAEFEGYPAGSGQGIAILGLIWDWKDRLRAVQLQSARDAKQEGR
jgi:hypothetical protein